MSYILDALRRADSERDRASIPGLHTQPVPQGSADSRPSRGPRPWAWVVVGVLVVLLGQWGARWLFHDAPPPAAASAAAPPAAPVVAQPAVLMAEPMAPPRPAAAAEATLPPEAAPKSLPDLPVVTPKPPPAKTRSAAAPASAAAEGPIYAQNELPEDIRRSLPPLQIGGSVYSEEPSARFVIVNGLIFHESDTPAPGVVLERIELKSAVLSYKGTRFRIAY